MNRKQVGAWALFDFANSVYPAVIQTVVFNYFFIQVVVGNDAGQGDWWWGRAVSLSAIFVAVTSPLLGAIADRAGVRKRLMLLYVAVCVAAVALFTTIEPGMIAWAFTIYVIANIGFEGALVFYNSYLPDIAPPEKHGFVSGLGFGVGYAASFLGLAAALFFVQRFDNLDLVWLFVAGFFAVFSIPTFLYLPKDGGGTMSVGRAAAWGLTSFREIFGEVLQNRNLFRFLLAYFFYIDGILTVIVMANSFAATTFGFTDTQLIYLFMVVQIAALVGAFGLAKPTDVWGPKKVLTGVILLWCVVALIAYFITSRTAFWALAVVAGFGLGSAQAASRAFMASLVPDGKEAEMFGFYAFCGRASSIIGPMLFGLVAVSTGGDQRLAVLAIASFYVIGLVLLGRVRDPKAATI